MDKFVRLMTLFAFASLAFAASDDGMTQARELFARYVALEGSFDAAIADLYADDARIVNRGRYPSGEVRELAIPAPQYKSLIRGAMPLAAARGDRSSYTNASYTPEGQRIRIRATRFSELKRYSSPFSLLVGRTPSGTWRIHEELSESQP